MEYNLKNSEIEQILLGAIITRNHLLQKIIFLESKHFANQIHQEIFTFIKTQVQNNDECNIVTIEHNFKGNKDLPEGYIRLLVASATGVMGVQSYAKIIKSLHDKRILLKVINQQMSKIETDIEAVDIVEEINKQVSDIQISNSQYAMTTYEQAVDKMIDEAQIERVCRPTGFNRIDKSMNGGLERSKSYCLAAPPKSFKTMLKGSIANNIRKTGARFLFIAAEMGSIQITQRLVSADINENPNDLYNLKRKGDAADEIRKKLMKYRKTELGNMLYNDSPRIPLETLRSVVANAVKTKQVEGIILDYLQLVQGKSAQDTIAQHQENVAQTIAELAKKYNIWFLYSAQINREGTIRNGSGIEMAAHWVYQIQRCELKYQGDEPKEAYLKYIAGRSTRPVDIGDENNPSLKISDNGTHLTEIGYEAH